MVTITPIESTYVFIYYDIIFYGINNFWTVETEQRDEIRPII